SSPALYRAYEKWKEGGLSQKEEKKLFFSLGKYLLRMRARCTPFGLMAGCSVLGWGDRTDIELPPREKYTRRTRLDMQFLCELAQKIEKENTARETLLFFPNGTLYKSQSSYRYIEHYVKDGARKHQISSVSANPYLEKILVTAEEGARFKQLVASLRGDEISGEEAAGFVHEIIDAQLLVSEIEPNVTGRPLGEKIGSFLKNNRKNGMSLFHDSLSGAIKKMGELDRQVGNDIAKYINLHKSIGQLGIKADENKLFQVDMFKPTGQAVLSSGIKQQLMGVCRFLEKLSNKSENSNLQRFKRAFVDRYGEKDMPLSQALDTETGVGYGGLSNIADTPLLGGIHLPPEQRGREIKFKQYEQTLFREICHCLSGNTQTLDLKKLEKELLENFDPKKRDKLRE
ncbi:MAG TPA: hypothetical protein ENJ95_23605, partial [Bacteroidetes bacterium]|nr:hypothetical protein [Bacteroidota bacterium]